MWRALMGLAQVMVRAMVLVMAIHNNTQNNNYHHQCRKCSAKPNCNRNRNHRAQSNDYQAYY